LSSISRWTSADPLGLIDGTNQYGYSKQNPVSFQDRTGTQGSKSELTGTPRIAWVDTDNQLGMRAKPNFREYFNNYRNLSLEEATQLEGLLRALVFLSPASLGSEENIAKARQAIRDYLPFSYEGESGERTETLVTAWEMFFSTLLHAPLEGAQADAALAVRSFRPSDSAAVVQLSKAKVAASNEYTLLRQTAKFLQSEGFDAMERRLIIDAGFRGVIDSTTPVTHARFERMLVRELGMRDIGLLEGRLGDLDTRVAVLMKGRELEASGLTVKYEYFVGSFKGPDGLVRDRYLDIAVLDKSGSLVEGFQGVKQANLSGPMLVNPREAGLAKEIEKRLGVPIHEINTGIQRPSM
jgi:hypothetical protein